MAAVILVIQPMPPASVNARVVEAAMWLFAAIGALVARRPAQDERGSQGLRWADGAAILLAVLVVRLTVRGIPFVP